MYMLLQLSCDHIPAGPQIMVCPTWTSMANWNQTTLKTWSCPVISLSAPRTTSKWAEDAVFVLRLLACCSVCHLSLCLCLIDPLSLFPSLLQIVFPHNYQSVMYITTNEGETFTKISMSGYGINPRSLKFHPTDGKTFLGFNATTRNVSPWSLWTVVNYCKV